VPHLSLALDMVRVEWARVLAFDGDGKPPLSREEVRDIPTGLLRFGLQPYLILLKP
jgi:hypothetical protein